MVALLHYLMALGRPLFPCSITVAGVELSGIQLAFRPSLTEQLAVVTF